MTSTWCGSRVGCLCVFGLGLVASAATASPTAGAEWSDDDPAPDRLRYVLPAPGDPHEFPPPRAIRLTDSKSDDLRETAEFRGRARVYGQIVFGSPGSVPVAVVVDAVSDSEVDLYVDANRNRNIEPKERHTLSLSPAGQSEPLRLALDVAVVDGKVTTTLPRTIALWVGRGGRSLRYAAVGYLEGEVDLDGRKVPIRRVDADADGFVTGPSDLLWLDLDANGRWDPFTERFAASAVLRLGGKLYAFRSDLDGASVSLARIEGTGSVACSLDSLKSPQSVREVRVSLVGRDGSPVAITSVGTPVAVPPGDYRPYWLTLVLDDPDGGDPWYFDFEPPTRQSPTAWHAVDRDGKTTIDPLAGMSFDAVLHEPPLNRTKPDQPLTILTRLLTGDGLSLVICCRSRTLDRERAAEADVSLSSGGETLTSAKVGFS